MWHYTGAFRPPFADTPATGQESVWDYPRPPRLQADTREVTVSLDGVPVARTRRALRLLETASPPTFYLPSEDVDLRLLLPAAGSSGCEWKGVARYWTLQAAGRRLERCAWSYPDPRPAYAALRGHVGFYPGLLDCRVDGQRVRPQPGGFYAGWITDEIVGPVKGAPGTEGW